MSKLEFSADYACPTHPAVVEAITKACSIYPGNTYGDDELTGSVVKHFGGAAQVLFCSTGTAANSIALSTIVEDGGAIICAETSHIHNHECGALERLGYKLLPVPAVSGKLSPENIERVIEKYNNVHTGYPSAISIANATECGTVYSYEELKELLRCAEDHHLKTHLDGARLAHAAAHNDHSSLMDIIDGIEFDVATIGATKNGGYTCDAVVIRDSKLKRNLERRHKQQGHLCARTHVLAAEFLALLKNNLWLELAQHANSMASVFGDLFHTTIGWLPAYPVQSNSIFLWLHPDMVTALKEVANFYEWDVSPDFPPDRTLTRFACSWNTKEEDVRKLVKIMKAKWNEFCADWELPAM